MDDDKRTKVFEQSDYCRQCGRARREHVQHRDGRPPHCPKLEQPDVHALDPEKVDTFNFALVGANASRFFVVGVGALFNMTHEQALVLAAYLVAMNDHAEHFARVLERVREGG